MRISDILLGNVLATLAASQKIYQGFNSGATLDTNTPKTKNDYLKEFKTAAGLKLSPGVFNSVRLYTNVQASTTNTPLAAFEAALETNTSILVGIWCSGTTSIGNELTALKSALSAHGQPLADLILGISVGSEDLYRISESGVANNAGLGNGPTQIVGFINETRTAMVSTLLKDKPVGHVDSWSAWVNSSNSAVIDAVDFIGTDLYPYYEDNLSNSIENAASIFDNLYANVTNSAGSKDVWVTETGWPVSGPASNQAVPSVENAQKYWSAVGCKLFGRTNTWWYNVRDSNPANKEKFAITKDLGTTAVFNLTCPADSGAPAAVNTSGAQGLPRGNGVIALLCVATAMFGFLV